MKLSLLFLVLWLPLFASTEKKIIIASFPTQEHAEKAVRIFKSKLDAKFLAKQNQSFFSIVARPSGKSYIIAIEPLQNYKEAQEVKALLPHAYSDAFINNYTPPKPHNLTEKTVSAIAEKASPTPVKKPSFSQAETSMPAKETQRLVKNNTLEPEQKKTNEQPVIAETDVVHPSAVTQQIPSTQSITSSKKEPPMLSGFLRLDYLLIGISVLTLILLLCFLRYYRKYHHLKKQLVSNDTQKSSSKDHASKPSDIFFVRQH